MKLLPLTALICLIAWWCERGSEPEYSIWKLRTERQQAQSVVVVGVTVLDGKVLVAIPEAAWNRRKALRVLPTGTFTKAINVSVQGADVEVLEVALEETYWRVWLGFFSAELVGKVVMTDQIKADLIFGYDPQGRSGAGTSLPEGGVSSELEARFRQIEDGLRSMRDALHAPLSTWPRSGRGSTSTSSRHRRGGARRDGPGQVTPLLQSRVPTRRRKEMGGRRPHPRCGGTGGSATHQAGQTHHDGEERKAGTRARRHLGPGRRRWVCALIRQHAQQSSSFAIFADFTAGRPQADPPGDRRISAGGLAANFSSSGCRQSGGDSARVAGTSQPHPELSNHSEVCVVPGRHRGLLTSRTCRRSASPSCLEQTAAGCWPTKRSWRTHLPSPHLDIALWGSLSLSLAGFSGRTLHAPAEGPCGVLGEEVQVGPRQELLHGGGGRQGQKQAWNSMHRWILNSGGFFFFPAIQLSEVGRLHRGHGFPDLAHTSPISLWTATRTDFTIQTATTTPPDHAVRCRRKAVNLLVVLLNWLHVKKVAIGPDSCRVGAPLNRLQHPAVIFVLRWDGGVWNRKSPRHGADCQ